MKKIFKKISVFFLLCMFMLILAGCEDKEAGSGGTTDVITEDTYSEFDIKDIPPYSGSTYVEVNNNVPFFTDDEMTTVSYESYSELDYLGRCGVAMACIGVDIMPTEERGEIWHIKPTGWHSIRYPELIEDESLYNRSHLIAFQLAAENDNEKNLITGTDYMNEGMIPFEIEVGNYVRDTGNHVMYRVTPIFEGENLVASGVLMEAKSVEDNGKAICFNVYCYNVQPGIGIDYATGDSWIDDGQGGAKEADYVLNTNSRKFHYPDCESVTEMNQNNRKDYAGTREELLDMGYEPCGTCRP